MSAGDVNRGQWAVGLMTGTVLDGNIDVAFIKTDGEHIFEFGPAELIRYPAALCELLKQTLDAASQWQFQGPEPALFRETEIALSDAQADAVQTLLDRHNISNDQIAVVGFHGQTVLHRRPASGKPGRTRQLGDGQRMADRLGVTVVHDFRTADVAAGGQGAPLVPVYHAALLRHSQCGTDTAVLNLGGVANITAFNTRQELIAFDTGPANAPLNDFMAAHDLGNMDRDGELAASGNVDDAKLAALLEHPYFNEPYPKSLDRNEFTAAMAEGCDQADGAALLTAFVAAAVRKGLDALPIRPSRLIVCGGGRLNTTLMQQLEFRTGIDVVTAEAVNWRGDSVEAECFAYLAMRALHDRPQTFPGTTGVSQPLSGGIVSHPRGCQPPLHHER